MWNHNTIVWFGNAQLNPYKHWQDRKCVSTSKTTAPSMNKSTFLLWMNYSVPVKCSTPAIVWHRLTCRANFCRIKIRSAASLWIWKVIGSKGVWVQTGKACALSGMWHILCFLLWLQIIWWKNWSPWIQILTGLLFQYFFTYVLEPWG